jgi:transposase
MDSSRGALGIIMCQAAFRFVEPTTFVKEESTMKHTIAVDLAKSVFQIAVSRRPGSVSEHHRLSRARFERFFAERESATVLFEACSSAHHWARHLQTLGHAVVLLPPHTVRPYVTRNKTDRTDAKALLEAYRNQDIHPVPVKSLDQHSLAALHRYRSAYVAERTARIKTTRGILREFGLTIPTGARNVVPAVQAIFHDPNRIVPHPLGTVLIDVCNEIHELEARIRGIERKLDSLAKDNAIVTRLRTIPGIGLLTATALFAFVGDVHRFRSGRHFASYLGLTPREHSSGAIRRIGRISKRGDAYLRMLLIHGARAVLCHAKKLDSPDRLRAWALHLEQSRGHNIAAVALANRLTRIAWAVWKRGGEFTPMN